MSHGLPRFSIIPADAVTDRRLEGRDLQVLALFGRHTDRRGWCCRSQVKMARELGCGRATVQRSIARLVEAGYLEHRVKFRESGGDTAHEYRVVLDAPDHHGTGEIPQYVDDEDGAEIPNHNGQEGVPASGQGVPTSGHGCPPKDGQGVPTHERAPRLTTLVKRNRESARDDEEEFELARRAWPSGFADSRADALAAWLALSPEDRREAALEINRFASTNKAIGRKLICGFVAYLREQRWKALPARPTQTGKSAGLESRKVEAAPPKPTRFMLSRPDLFPDRVSDGGEISHQHGEGVTA